MRSWRTFYFLKLSQRINEYDKKKNFKKYDCREKMHHIPFGSKVKLKE